MILRIEARFEIKVTDEFNEALEQGDPDAHGSLLRYLRVCLKAERVELVEMGPHNTSEFGEESTCK